MFTNYQVIWIAVFFFSLGAIFGLMIAIVQELQRIRKDK